ncbi:hypothetical protein INT45_007634 [Circinella minor]|uniref:Uncharacterized protein n=1 Tax=Circinella minor TaxID=1195481 RepID=A0A8H7RU58_9FUNG|nr:hypothetical protein INT45_007634 [Circinella minor]
MILAYSPLLFTDEEIVTIKDIQYDELLPFGSNEFGEDEEFIEKAVEDVSDAYSIVNTKLDMTKNSVRLLVSMARVANSSEKV